MSRAGPGKDGEPALPLPLRRFLELFNRGEFWDSHEALEEAWRERDSDFYHGLILYASALVHARRGTRHGIRAQMEKAGEALASIPSPYLGLDVEAIRRHAARCREIVEGQPEGSEPDWEELIPFPTLETAPDRIRGDEPELRAG